MEIRAALPHELQAVAELTEAAYRAVPDSGLDEDYFAHLADVEGRARHAVVLVAVGDDGKLEGSVTYVPRSGPYAEFAGDDEAGLRMLAVAPDAQGRGVGTALVESCLARARAEGKSRMVLHTMASMTTAHRIYERLGFRRAPERNWYFPSGDGCTIAYVLELGAKG